MATNPQTASESSVDRILKLKVGAQKRVLDYAQKVLEKHKQFPDARSKMDAIDIAYARYKAAAATAESSGQDIRSVDANVCCNVFEDDEVTPPIVVSQVDSYVAYLAEVFLSGEPLFPVVASPSKRLIAENLEALIDDHAALGGYARQLLMFLRDAAKYNFSAIEADWDSIDQFSVLDDINSPKGQSVKRVPKKFTKLKRLNPRNTVWDFSINPGDVAEHGDYAGYVERLSRTKLKRLLNKWTKENKVYNADRALESVTSSAAGYTPNYTEDPQVSKYVSSTNRTGSGIDWDRWFEPGTSGRPNATPSGAMYEKFVLYARIMPADYEITAPAPNTPQIWKFVIINNQWMVYAERIISAYDYLPILFGQPLEDGLGYQTQSIAEGEIPFQKAASTLFNIRFAAARRAVSDRALYIADMIAPTDINSKVPAPKIPVNISALSNKTLDQAYKQIPFDMRGTETTINDAQTIVQFSKDLHGINNPRQGQFQKGNKSVQEWNDTMGGSDGRLRLPALTLEHQVFSPLKSILALNIFQYGDDGVIVSRTSGKQLEIKIDELRRTAMSFKMADGYTPKSKLASTDVLVQGMQFLQQSPILQQSFGMMLPKMFIQFLSLSGLKGFEEFDPNYQDPSAVTPTPGLPVQNLQAPGMPNGAPVTPQAPPGPGQVAPGSVPPSNLPVA